MTENSVHPKMGQRYVADEDTEIGTTSVSAGAECVPSYITDDGIIIDIWLPDAGSPDDSVDETAIVSGSTLADLVDSGELVESKPWMDHERGEMGE
jgi:hypothetical protein